LGLVRPLRLAARLVEAGGALVDALLQGFVAALELGLGAAEVGDVGGGGDEAAAGHRVATDLDDATVGKHALADVGRACAHVPLALGRFGIAPATDVTGQPASLAGWPVTS